MGTNTRGPDPIESDFEGDPQMRELIEFFVSEMPAKASRLSALFECQQIEDLERLAHQLKGAAGGYGFGVISEAAADLVVSIRAEEELERLRSQVEQLIDLCRRTRSATNP